METISGSTVSKLSPASCPEKTDTINHAFTASDLMLSDHSYPVISLQQRYKHLQGLPLPSIHKATPLLLIGSDHIHLITPIAPVKLGPYRSPAAVKTLLGWTLQGPMKDFVSHNSSVPCLYSFPKQFCQNAENHGTSESCHSGKTVKSTNPTQPSSSVSNVVPSGVRP